MPGRSVPSITRTTMTTPRYGSYQESKISAFSGASGCPPGGGSRCDDRLEDLRHAGAHLGAGEDRAGAVEADDVRDLAARFFGLRAGQVDLVDDRDDLEVVLDGEVGVGQRLRLDALRGVHEQQRALARRERARDLVREVDVARRVDQVEDVLLAGVRRVVQPDRMRLDRDAALALEVHRVEHLRFHLARLQRAGDLEEPVGQRRLAVVDVGDDREVADVAGIHDQIRGALRGSGFKVQGSGCCSGFGVLGSGFHMPRGRPSHSLYWCPETRLHCACPGSEPWDKRRHT